MTRNFIAVCFLLIALVLVGCTSASQANDQLPTDAPAEPQATVVFATATATPVPTATAMPIDEPATPTNEPAPTVTPAATATPEMITGDLALARGQAGRRLWAVMLDNHPRAYPQVGLDKSVLVFEALAEFGITRYLAIYAPDISPEFAAIGAVRSARPYFVEWAQGLQAVFVHAGGSPEALQMLQQVSPVSDMDALNSSAEDYFWRSAQRDAPHNLFTSSENIAAYVADRELGAFDPRELGFLFKRDLPPGERPAGRQIDYFFIYPEDPAGWVYDAESNGYFRTRRGVPHTDGASGEQLWFKNVVVMEVFEALIPGDDKGRIEQQVIGAGRALAFFDGQSTEITWRKPSAAEPVRFYNADGSELRLNAGPVWLVALPALDNLTVE
jgi:hypothetical protein